MCNRWQPIKDFHKTLNITVMRWLANQQETFFCEATIGIKHLILWPDLSEKMNKTKKKPHPMRPCVPQNMCWDPICNVAEFWCCSEHYLQLFLWQFILGPIYCNVLLSCGRF